MKLKSVISSTITGALTLPLFATQTSEKPNIILILADDMGYSDIGCYGGEIQTPNIDRLAAEGIRYTQFYNAARSCPTRASLMTGLYPHQAGMGWMTVANLGTPQYQGELNKKCLTIAEVLKSAGYATYMSGKWHLTRNYDETQSAEKHNWPLQRGFDRFFGTIPGGGNYYTPNGLATGNTIIKAKQPFYYTEAISDSAVGFIRENVSAKKRKPFFMYVAYTAPHWPLHAKPADIQKYKGRYDKGWDVLREERYERMKKMGIIPENTVFPARNEDAAAWYTIPKRLQPELAHRMEVYAAQIDNMDQGIGRILAELEKSNQMDNTIILFLSDNGACAEMITNENQTAEIGTKETFESYGLAWANASNAPFQMFKHWTHEGGIATPMIVHWPKVIKPENQGKFWNKPAHLVDIMATFVEVGKADYAGLMKKNKEIQALEGQSLTSTFQLADNNRKPIFWEHEANIGMRDGKWKMVAKTKEGDANIGKLELYDIDADRSECNDLSAKYPELTKKMYDEWLVWANRIGVFPLDAREYNERARASRKNEEQIWQKRKEDNQKLNQK
ncbi:MAG: arylsulfatase [Paludibacter sp.]|nr:arylsulfatase [Paludibacter sp.]